MKQLKNKRYIQRLLLLVAATLSFYSCADEDVASGLQEEEKGIPVTVQLKYDAPSMSVVSRSLTTDEENKVNNLCILIFDADTHERKTIQYYDYESLTNTSNPANHTNSKQLFIETTTGSSYIVGVANVTGSQMAVEDTYSSIYDYLEKEATTWNAFKQCRISLNAEGNVTRTTASLVMCGYYDTEGNTPEPVNIDRNTATLDKYIHLRRLDAHVTFNVIIDSKNITTFQPVSWKVVNVPVSSSVCEGESDTESTSYDESEENIHFNSETDNQHSFDFYMLENRKTVSENGIISYADREKKGTDGAFTNAPQNATYVEIRAKMEMNATNENGVPVTRVADVKYTIHLGYCDGSTEAEKAKDFDCERNIKYIYNIKIKGVDKIVVEVTSNKEEEPGAEGDVVDTGDGENKFMLDAHYSTFNIEITENDIINGKLSYNINTPFNTIDSENVNEGNYENSYKKDEDFSWIKFRKTTEKNILAEYAYDGINKTKPDDIGELLDLYELSKNPVAGYYTVFINEYVYPDKHWNEYVNQSNRQVLLAHDKKISTDGHSSYAKPKYLISQRSIQTYYKTMDDKIESAIGIEHVNETSRRLNWTLKREGWSESNGWENCSSVLKNQEWKTYATITQPDAVTERYTFQMEATGNRTYYDGFEPDDTDPKYYEIMYACLSRNRDENGNGKIDEDELKWYVPAIDQYLDIYLGAESLETPLFDASSNPVPGGNSNSIWSCRNEYHYASSNRWKLFSEQGSSTNVVTYTNNPGQAKEKWAQQIRCIRNLNKDRSVSKLPEEVYSFDDNELTFTMSFLNSRSIRPAAVEKNWFTATHHNFTTDINMPYMKFQVAKEYCTIANNDWGNKYDTKWQTFVNDGTACKDYSEKADGSDKGTWRAPNQKELMLIFKELRSGQGASDYTSSCTRWKYGNRHCLISGTVIFLDDNKAANAVKWRCVKDVK